MADGTLSSIEAQFRADFSAFAAILRLSTKYDVPSLRSRAMSVITTMYPTSLAEFQQRSVMDNKLPAWDFVGRPVAILALAEECRVRSVVPAALYCLSTQPSAYFFDELVVPGPPASASAYHTSINAWSFWVVIACCRPYARGQSVSWWTSLQLRSVAHGPVRTYSRPISRNDGERDPTPTSLLMHSAGTVWVATRRAPPASWAPVAKIRKARRHFGLNCLRYSASMVGMTCARSHRDFACSLLFIGR
jgi:hypothetical protein